MQASDANGMADVVITAQDVAGNSTALAVPGAVTVDTSPLTITQISELSNNPNLGFSGAPGHTAKAGDIVTETFQVDPSAPGMPITVDSVTIDGRTVTATSLGNDQYSASYTVQSSDLNTPFHEIVVTAHDQVGNSTTQTLNGYMETFATPPQISITSTAGNTSEAQHLITWTVEGSYGIGQVTLFDGTSEIWRDQFYGGSGWQALVTLSGQGIHSLTASFTDFAGNIATSNPIAYVLDQIPFATIASAGAVTNQATQTINGQGVPGATITIKDGSTTLGITQVAPDGSWSSDITLSDQGEHAITAVDTTTAAPVFTTLATFPKEANGDMPLAGLAIDEAGNLFGTTNMGGVYASGAIFELSGLNHGTLTTLYSFNWSDGGYPATSMILDSVGNLYGTTTGSSTVFELSGADHQSLSTLISYVATGETPSGPLAIDAAGNLYGTVSGGTGSRIFELSGPNHDIQTTLVATDASAGLNIQPGLMVDAAGNIYGISAGGTNNKGAIFELSGTNHQTITTLVNFDGNNGASPFGALVADSAGNLYGSTASGGLYNNGTIFELSGIDHETITTLYSFETRYVGQLSFNKNIVLDTSGNIYGTTLYTVFELSGPNHQTLTTLATGIGEVQLTIDSAGHI